MTRSWKILALGFPLLLVTAAPSPVGALCPGDCNLDFSVTIDELLLGVRLAAAHETAHSCPAFDKNGDRHITVDELVAAVRTALNGCHRISACMVGGCDVDVEQLAGIIAFPSQTACCYYFRTTFHPYAVFWCQDLDVETGLCAEEECLSPCAGIPWP